MWWIWGQQELHKTLAQTTTTTKKNQTKFLIYFSKFSVYSYTLSSKRATSAVFNVWPTCWPVFCGLYIANHSLAGYGGFTACIVCTLNYQTSEGWDTTKRTESTTPLPTPRRSLLFSLPSEILSRIVDQARPLLTTLWDWSEAQCGVDNGCLSQTLTGQSAVPMENGRPELLRLPRGTPLPGAKADMVRKASCIPADECLRVF